MESKQVVIEKSERNDVYDELLEQLCVIGGTLIVETNRDGNSFSLSMEVDLFLNEHQAKLMYSKNKVKDESFYVPITYLRTDKIYTYYPRDMIDKFKYMGKNGKEKVIFFE